MGEVAFDAGVVEQLKGDGKGVAKLTTNKGEICKVASLKGATVR